jgi:hypothetical protein
MVEKDRLPHRAAVAFLAPGFNRHEEVGGMSAAVHANNAVHALEAGDEVLATEARDARRPNVSGDLPTLFEALPQFRRAVAGYDRFQVDTYVQWAEDELATAEREREHLVARHLQTRADLEEAQRLLTHSAGGRELVGMSDRMGTLLAAAADEADGIRADARKMRDDAEAERIAAAEHAGRMAAEADQALADARAAAERLMADAGTEAEELVAEAGRVVTEAERTRDAARAEAVARLDEVRAAEERAVAYAESVRQQAENEATATRLRARGEIVGMLATGREERRRADAEAAEARERLDRDAVVRRTALLVDVAALEQRRSALRAEIELLAASAAGRTSGHLQESLHRLLDRLHWPPRHIRAH